VINRPFLLRFVGYQLIFLIEKENAELLRFFKSHLCCAVVD